MDKKNEDLTIEIDNTKPLPPSRQLAPKKRQVFAWLKYKHSQLNKKQKILVTIGMAVVLIGGASGTYLLYKHFYKSPGSSKAKQATPPILSKLTGVQVNAELYKRPVTGIMIENSPDSRPQSGLKDAGVVFEAVAEGGITRFLALYQEAQPDYIGPVRSVRPYYLDWLMPFDASIAHVGGAPQALSDIKALGIKDLDQFYSAGGYQRVTTRYAPHNVYTSMAKMDDLNRSKGFGSSNFTGFNRKKDSPATQLSAKTVDINISNSAFYGSHYDYDAITNSYKRSEGGAAHTDEKSGAQLNPKVVVVLVTPRGIAGDGQHTNYGTTAGGKLYVFQDGVVTEGSWAKADRRSQFVITNASGASLKFNAGQTWLTMVDGPASVTFAP